MQRRATFLLAGFLTAGVITGVVSFAYNATADASANSVGLTLDTTNAASETVTERNATADLAAVYEERENALKFRVGEGERAVAALDETMQRQISDLNAEIQIVSSQAAEKAQNIVGLQESATQLQAQIEQEGQTFQQQVAALQGRDSQIRIQLEAALSELQAAYDQLAARQASMASGGGSDGGGSSATYQDDDHEGDEGHDDEHDDEHEDSEHGEEHEHDDD